MSFPGRPGALFNPATDPVPLSPWELLAGPLGLIAFLPLVPLVRAAARWNRAAALVAGGLIWLIATTGPSAAILLGGVLLGAGYVALLGAAARRGRLSRRWMIALVWIGLHLMALPLWWTPDLIDYGWRGGRMAALHAMGFSYFLLRLVAWGVDWAGRPDERLRPVDTLCWLLYPPCMRNGPILRRQHFLERLDAWRPEAPPALRQAAGRLGLALLGLAALAVVARNTPHVAPAGADFFESPQSYSTWRLVRVFYFVPMQIYLFLWAYNELAAGLSAWLGLRVDDNFDHLPRARSVREFWHRWHVTVGAWLRDYVYVPLGGNRGPRILGARAPVALNYAAVFGYCALWHGASASFLAWGLSQAAALTVQRAWDRLAARRGWRWPRTSRVWAAASWLLTMHYQLASIVVFADFEHMGVRFLGELFGRLVG